MQFVLIIHEVEDYSAWKKGFDKAANIRKEAGEIAYQVLVDNIKPNKVVHFSHWKNHELAKAFFESEKVKKIREQLGVKQPHFIYLNQLEKGILVKRAK